MGCVVAGWVEDGCGAGSGVKEAERGSVFLADGSSVCRKRRRKERKKKKTPAAKPLVQARPRPRPILMLILSPP